MINGLSQNQLAHEAGLTQIEVRLEDLYSLWLVLRVINPI